MIRINKTVTLCQYWFFIIFFTAMLSMAQPKRNQDRTAFDQMDNNNDDKIALSEFKGPDQLFFNMDSNNDGFVDRNELLAFQQNMDRNIDPDKEAYPDLIIINYDKDKAWHGNVIFVDKNWNRIVEADLEGNIVWECSGPDVGVSSTGQNRRGARLTDVELLPNDHVLVLNGGDGVYEINRTGQIVWSYRNKNVSHDADRLENGNTLMACVGAEKASEFPYKDPQAIEVNRQGDMVWSWHAKKEYASSAYKNIRSQDAHDWTHMNSVQRLKDGNTLLCVRNWNLLIAVNAKSMTEWTTGAKEVPNDGWGEDSPHCPHTAIQYENGPILISEPIKGRVIEWNPEQEKVVWCFPNTTWQDGGDYYFIRAAHRLPNGNTFIIDSLGQFLEVTRDGTIVWHARLSGYRERSKPPSRHELVQVPCFNADRRGMSYYGGR